MSETFTSNHSEAIPMTYKSLNGIVQVDLWDKGLKLGNNALNPDPECEALYCIALSY